MKRIFIIGFMGAGKTSVGRSLALRMNLSYIDTDYYIEKRYRKKVSEIFATEGEASFREIERRILLEISEFENIVIATGGGLPCFNDNMRLMNEKGITVYLDVPVEELASRLRTSKITRPVLNKRSGEDLVQFINDSLSVRKPFYEQASIWYHAGNSYTDDDIEQLVKALDAL